MDLIVDRGGWSRGMWDAEPDSLSWQHSSGLSCLILRALSGHLCGYVGVPEGHDFYESDFALCREKQLSCHGGVSFLGRLPQDRSLWWVGFDCNHLYDLTPSDTEGFVERKTYKSFDYVKDQVNALAWQLASF